MSSLAVYEMPPEFKAKLHRQLDPSRVAQAASRLSVPRSSAAVTKATSSAADKEKNVPAKRVVVAQAPLKAKPPPAAEDTTASARSSGGQSSGSGGQSSGSSSPNSAYDSSASSQSSGQHKQHEADEHVKPAVAVLEQLEVMDQKLSAAPKTTDDARRMLRGPSSPKVPAATAAPAAAAARGSSPAPSSPAASPSPSAGAPAPSAKAVFAQGGAVPAVIATSPIRFPKLLALAQKNAFSPVHQTPDAAAVKSDADAILASLASKRGVFGSGQSRALARQSRASSSSDPRLFKLDDGSRGHAQESRSTDDATRLAVLSTQGKKLRKA